MSAESARYYAHAAGAAHGHTVEASSFETAALAFTEAWAPEVGPGDPVRILVQAEDGGPEHCFVVHLDDGDVEACG